MFLAFTGYINNYFIASATSFVGVKILQNSKECVRKSALSVCKLSYFWYMMWHEYICFDVMWCDVMWWYVMWFDVIWCDVTWRDMTCQGVSWRDVSWRDVVMWCDIIYDVMWCVLLYTKWYKTICSDIFKIWSYMINLTAIG